MKKPRLVDHEVQQLHTRSDILQVFMLSYGEDGKKRLGHLLKSERFPQNTQNVILLMPMQPSEERKGEVWNCLSRIEYNVPDINISVVFYQTEMSTNMANASTKLLEVFVLNYMANGTLCVQEIDVENSADDQVSDCESNLNEKIFGQISKASYLITTLPTSVNESVTKIPFQRGNETLINLGSSSIYLLN